MKLLIFVILAFSKIYSSQIPSSWNILGNNPAFQYAIYQLENLIERNETNKLKFNLQSDRRLIIWTNLSNSPVSAFSAKVTVDQNVDFSVRMRGKSATWNFPCRCQNGYTILNNSVYTRCPSFVGNVFNASLDGSNLFVNGKLFWWESFESLEMEFSGSATSGDVEVTDMAVIGWSNRSEKCNCFYPGVKDVSSPCDQDDNCICLYGFQPPHCTFILNSSTSVYPNHGPFNNALLGLQSYSALENITSIFVGSTPCSLLNESFDTSSICNPTRIVIYKAILDENSVGQLLPVRVCWKDQCQVLDSYFFVPKAIPSVTSVLRNVTFYSGGLEVKVKGRNLDSLANPSLFVQIASEKSPFTSCDLEDNSKKICKSSDDGNELTCYYPLIITQESLNKMIPGYVSVPFASGRFNVTIFADPVIPDMNPSTQYYEESQYYLILNGNFLRGCTQQDYVVTVGGIRAADLAVIANTLSFRPPSVKPDKSSSDEDGASAVQVLVGTLNHHVGYIQYNPPFNYKALIGGLVAFGGVALVILVALVVWMKKKQRGCFKAEEEKRPSVVVSFVDKLREPLRSQVKRCLVSEDNLEIGKEIGKGNFGIVYQGFYKKREVAVKTSKSDSTFDRKREFLEEAVTNMDFSHPNVLTLIAITIKDDVPKVILPFMKNGDLKSFLTKYEELISAEISLKIVKQVAEGMEYLASKFIVHRDLAARNCMIDENLKVKVADFGLARDIYDNKYYRTETSDRPLPYYWMALECFNGKLVFSEKTDVWSFGVLMWEVYTKGESPYAFMDFRAVKEHLRSGHRLEKPPFATESIYTIMLHCWNEEPAMRPTFAELRKSLEDGDFSFPTFLSEQAKGDPPLSPQPSSSELSFMSYITPVNHDKS